MFLIIIAVFLGFSAIVLGVIVWRHRDVTGYEDESGFHYGAPPDDSLEALEWPEKRRQGGRR